MPHVAQLARLLHNRIVRRVRHSHPSAGAMLVVGDLVDGHVNLHPVALWDRAGSVVASEPATGPTSDPTSDPAAQAADVGWRLLVADLGPEFALLARVAPVPLFEPCLLDLRQIDLHQPEPHQPELHRPELHRSEVNREADGTA